MKVAPFRLPALFHPMLSAPPPVRFSRRRPLVGLALLFVLPILVTPHLLRAQAPAGYELTFSDDFNGSALDAAVWAIDPARPNVVVENGALHLTTEKIGQDGSGNDLWREGKLATRVWMQRFGYYEARFRIGAASGLNNAFWLNTPAPYSIAANVIDRMELDIMEAHYTNKLNYNTHDWAPTHIGKGGKATASVDLSAGYHTYAMEWAHDNTLRFYFNGELKLTLAATTLRDAETFIPLELLFSTKVIDFAGTPGPGLEGSRMSVDYVRAYDTPGFTSTASNNWGTETNWASGRYPRSTDAAIFNRPTVPATITIAGADKAAREIYLDHPQLPALTFVARSDFPAAVLRLGSSGAGAVTVNARVTTPQTVALPVVAEAALHLNQFSTAPGATLAFTAPLRATLAGETLNVLNSGAIDLRGSIEASFGPLRLIGPGTTRLGAANAHTGETQVLRGTLLVAADGALGATATGTRISSGGTLALGEGAASTAAEPVALSGTGAAGRSGALELLDATAATLASPLTLEAASTFATAVAGGRLTLTGAVQSTTATELTATGPGTLELAGPVHGLRNVIHRGPGTLRLSNSDSTFGSTAEATANGTLMVGRGTALVGADAPHSAPGALGRSSYRVRVGTAAYAIAGEEAALLIDGAYTVARPLQIEAGNQPAAAVIGNTGATVSRFTGAIFLQRELTVRAAEGGTVRLEGIAQDDTAPGALRIEGPGTVELTAVNRHTGGTTVAAGTLRLLGEVASPVLVSGGTLTGTGRIAAALTCAADGRLAATLPATPSALAPLRVDGTVTFAPGATLALAGETAADGSTWTLLRAGGFTGPLPQLALPTGWQGNLAVVGNELRFTLQTITGSVAAAWRTEHFGSAAVDTQSAAAADPDADGWTNLAEFALGLDPLAADGPAALALATAAERLTLTFARRAEPALTYTVEAAASPAGPWTSIWTSTGAQNTAGPVTVTDPVALTASPTRFLRLRLETAVW